MPINTTRRGYTAPGTKHTPVVRKGVGGRPVPRDLDGRTWPDLVAAGPPPADRSSPARRRARALFMHVPTGSKVTIPASDVPAPVLGQPSRRLRRPAAIAEAKRERRARAGRPLQTGGGYCPAHGLTRFYEADDAEAWREMHDHCPETQADLEQVSA